MKKIGFYFSFLALCLVGFLSCQETVTTTLYIVRHAEKMQDGSKDPELSADGVKRAEKLSEILNEVDLSAIYSSSFKRNQQTAQPVAKQKGLAIKPYNPARQKGLAKKIPSMHKGNSILIIGHSNTIYTLLNLLTDTSDFQELGENEYDKMYVVKIDEEGNVDVSVQTF